MCGSKKAIDVVPSMSPSQRKTIFRQPSRSSSQPSTTTANTTTAAFTSSSSSSISSRNSLSSLRSSLPENPHLYDISDIRTATNNFLAKNYSNSSSSSSSRSWRCNLHGKDVIIFQRKSHDHLRSSTVRQKLSSICKSHHVAVINPLGASISGDYIYLVYEYIQGANLADLLHNPNNPDFTVLNTWISRMQIATDLANGLDYIHNNTGLDIKFVHNHIKSSSVIVTEPSFNAKICHFGASELCGEPIEDGNQNQFAYNHSEIEEIIEEEKSTTSLKSKLTRSNSVKFNGTRGYMSPEFQSTGIGTRKSDVYSFGVVLLELFSGEEPVKYKIDKATKDYRRISAVETAGEVVADGGGGEREVRLRRWVDRRLRDSFPVEVAEKMTLLALDCVHVDPDKRPDMRRVAGKISKLYLESKAWCDNMQIPTEFTVSFAPR